MTDGEEPTMDCGESFETLVSEDDLRRLEALKEVVWTDFSPIINNIPQFIA